MTETKICPECNQAFTPKHGNQKYCGSECARIAKREQDYNAVFKYRVQWGNNNKGKGTGNLGPHRDADFVSELNKIKKELRAYGLA